MLSRDAMKHHALKQAVGTEVSLVVGSRLGYLITSRGVLTQLPDGSFMVRARLQDERGTVVTQDPHYHQLRNGTVAYFRAEHVAQVVFENVDSLEELTTIELRA